MSKKNKAYYSGIGGQAVFEGIMMRNRNKYSIVVRKSDGTMETVVKDVAGNPDKVIEKIPFVRGIFAFAESLKLGTEALEYSAEFYGTDTSEPTKLDKLLTKIFGKHTDSIISAFTMILSLLLCCGIFIVLPYLLTVILGKYIVNTSVISIIEGCFRILIIVVYALLLALVKDIRRTFMYHGAEHKCINCIEHGKKLTVDNVRNASRLHGRCSTNFIFIIAFFTIIVYVFFFKIESGPLRLLLRFAVIPVIAGVSYEILRIIGKYNNILTKILAAPGMALQFVTTREPDDAMILVAINAIEAVFDWKTFLVEKFPDDNLPEELGLEVKEEDKVKLSPKKEVKTNGKVKKKKKDIKSVITPEEEYADVGKQNRTRSGKTEELSSDENIFDEVVETDEYSDFEKMISNEDSEAELIEESVMYADVEEYEGVEAYEEAVEYEGIETYDEAGEYEGVEAYEEAGEYEGVEAYDKAGEYESADMYAENAEAEGVETYEESVAEEYEGESVTEESEDESNEEAEEEITENEAEYNEEETYGGDENDIPLSDEEADEYITGSEAMFESYVTSDDFDETDDMSDDVSEENIVSYDATYVYNEAEVLKQQKTQPIKLDFFDDYGFGDDEEVPEDEMSFEPVDESVTGEIDLSGYPELLDDEEGPKFSKNIMSMPMPDKINIVEVIPEGGMSSRIYNYDEEDSDIIEEAYEEDYENIFDERGRLTIKDTEAFNKKIDDEFEELFKKLEREINDN